MKYLICYRALFSDWGSSAVKYKGKKKTQERKHFTKQLNRSDENNSEGFKSLISLQTYTPMKQIRVYPDLSSSPKEWLSLGPELL